MRLSAAISIIIIIGCAGCSGLGDSNSTVLQQGLSPTREYSGCRTATLWPKAPPKAPAAGAKMLYLRGEDNRMLVKFDIPSESYDKDPKLRAKLELELAPCPRPSSCLGEPAFEQAWS